jgi:hypothetical protein
MSTLDSNNQPANESHPIVFVPTNGWVENKQKLEWTDNPSFHEKEMAGVLTSITQCIGQEDTDAEEYNWSIRDLEDNICVPRTISSNHSNIHESFGTEPHARISIKKSFSLPYRSSLPLHGRNEPYPGHCTRIKTPKSWTSYIPCNRFYLCKSPFPSPCYLRHPPSIQSPMQDKKLEEKKKKEKISSHDMYATCQSETYINIK